MKRALIVLCMCSTAVGGAAPAVDSTLSDDFYDAIRANDLARVRALADSKSAVNVTDRHGATPLMFAAVVGSVDAMKLLLARGADVNHQADGGATALMWAATDPAKVRLLLDSRADPNRATKGGQTALLLAAMSDRSADIVRLLIAKGASVKAIDEDRTTALVAAVLGNDTETIRLMIDAGIDVNAPNVAGLTPLMIAAGFSGNVRATTMLLARGAQVNAVSGPSIDPPDTAKAGPVQIGSLTPLLAAAPFGPPAVVKALVDAGVDVNARDVRGMTPLMLAVATDHQNPAIIRMLLDRGADPAPKSKAGETAADWARKIGRPSALALLNVRADEPRATAARSLSLTPKDRVERSVALLEKTSVGFYQGSGCVSCHHQAMTDLAAGEARAHGVRVDDAAAQDRLRMAQAYYVPEALYERSDPPGAPEQTAYSLAGLAAMGHPPDRMTDAMVANILAEQAANGSWHSGLVARPPGEEGDLFRTALCVRALKVYGPPGRRLELDARIEKARRWIAAASPETAEDRSMQLLGLAWTGADAASLRRLVKVILAEQQPDGGWRQNDGLPPDAYATGESLYALAVGGVAVSDPAYQRGLSFLFATQAEDGSWRVTSRAPKIQVYFNSGFPYAGNQWVSAWATGWAAMAAAQSIPAPRAAAQ